MLLLREARPREVGVLEARRRHDQVGPHNINELGATGSGPPQATAQQASALTVSGRVERNRFTPGCWCRTSHTHSRFDSLGFRCSSLCVPPCFVETTVNLSSSGLKLSSVGVAEVEHFGTTSVRKQLVNQASDIIIEVAAVSCPIASLSLGLRMGSDGVFWIRVDDAGNAETALRLQRRARQVRSKKLPVFTGGST